MHRLKDFKNFGSASLDLFQPLTILLGRNGAGKTNLLEGIELMAALARGVPVNEITDVGRGGTLEVRGGLASCARFRTTRFELCFDEATVEFEGEQRDIRYSIEMAEGNAAGIHLAAERLTVGARVFFEAHSENGEVLDIAYDNFAPGRNPRCQLSASSSVLSRYSDVVANSKTAGTRLHDAREVVAGVMAHVQRSHIFDPTPASMRNYERKNPQPNLLRNGSNLSSVLFALAKGNDDRKKALARITATIRQIPEEPFEEIRFVETQLGDVMAGFGSGSGFGHRLIDARLLSDGTLRMLAVLTALETVPQDSRIVIEEFDAGLHPSRAELLIRHITKAATRRKLNVVLTTHNPAFMNALDDAQLRSVWICHRDASNGTSSVVRLADTDCLETIGLTGGLGDYVTRGVLEKRLSADYPEHRRQAMRQWLDALP